jgi:integrase
LKDEEVRDVLAYVRDHATAGFVYPMFVFCALTGARRSELCRSRIDDFDFENMVVQVRERKRDRTKKETIRTVEMHPKLRDVMQSWFAGHPGGPYTLSQHAGCPLTKDEATDHFNRTLEGSDAWKHIPGFHTFRHSFASILASKGHDQRVIDALMGHQTDDMRKRYRHLFPANRKRAVDDLLP